MKTACGSSVKALSSFVTVVVLSGGVRASFRFGAVQNLGPTVNSSSSDGSPEISADGLTLYFDSMRSGGQGDWDIWMTTRAPGGEWGVPVPLPAPINGPYADAGPSISADGLSLYFASDRHGGYGNFDLWVTTRKTEDDPWEAPVNLGSRVNSDAYDNHPSISPDGLSLYFDSARPGGEGTYDIWVTTRRTTQDAWGKPVNLGPVVNSLSIELSPSICPGNRILFFDTRVPDRDIWVAFRRTPRGPWIIAMPVGESVNTWDFDSDPMLSADGSMLYFASDRPGGSGQDLWQIPISPVVDLNDDGVVDFKDFAIFARSWHQIEMKADIAPGPFGDGFANALDAAALARYWLTDFRLVAHWKLDESDGTVADDATGGHDGTLQGGPTWQPRGGRLGGALLLDGVDDCVITGFVRDPAEGPLSVSAWIKGGSPGQVILSQQGGADWLKAAATHGELMTGLRGGRSASLTSPVVITDGAWHRVRLVWDGSRRILYVDGAEVKKDTLPGMVPSSNGLYIGCGNSRKQGTYWSGLIDDVRIYDRAVQP